MSIPWIAANERARLRENSIVLYCVLSDSLMISRTIFILFFAHVQLIHYLLNLQWQFFLYSQLDFDSGASTKLLLFARNYTQYNENEAKVGSFLCTPYISNHCFLN